MQPETKSLVLGGGKFNTEVQFAGKGQPLLYLHGALGPATGWSPFLEILSEEFTVYAPRFPGYGATKGVENLDDISDLTLYHLELLDGLGVEKAHIIGHFLGGMVAAEIAAFNPHSVDRLVLASPAGLWTDDAPVADFLGMSPANLERLLWADPESEVAQQFATDSDETLALLAQERLLGMSSAGKFMWPIPDKGLKRRLYRVKVPVLVLWGAQDKVNPPVYAKLFSQGIAGARVEMIPDAGHMLMLEQPEEFVRYVVQFLKA